MHFCRDALRTSLRGNATTFERNSLKRIRLRGGVSRFPRSLVSETPARVSSIKRGIHYLFLYWKYINQAPIYISQRRAYVYISLIYVFFSKKYIFLWLIYVFLSNKYLKPALAVGGCLVSNQGLRRSLTERRSDKVMGSRCEAEAASFPPIWATSDSTAKRPISM